MELSWNLSLLVASLLLLAQVMAMPTTTTPTTTSKPILIVSSEEEPLPMMYHFIVDHRPTSLGQNYYIKPGQMVGMFNVDSDMLQVRHEDSKRNISSKLNILFVASAKEDEATTSPSLSWQY
ncbi:uncharacterized protein LOC117790490 [Drosophila innubila]|uniref:uncharacterized protein LOC117790490 n=1 Tax=Drosophila innubila TaxID=198719 RepID=UPI00148D2ABF|nr:uncharacterized protein LOC117790490 [Drosophila innubila]